MKCTTCTGFFTWIEGRVDGIHLAVFVQRVLRSEVLQGKVHGPGRLVDAGRDSEILLEQLRIAHAPPAVTGSGSFGDLSK